MSKVRILKPTSELQYDLKGQGETLPTGSPQARRDDLQLSLISSRHKRLDPLSLFSCLPLIAEKFKATYQKTYIVEVWDERAELRPEEIKIKPENIEFDKAPSEVKSITRDVNDQREKSFDDWDENKTIVKNSPSKVENSVKELEKKFFSETGESQKRAKILEETQKLKEEKQQYFKLLFF